jgi:hypothetical protein
MDNQTLEQFIKSKTSAAIFEVLADKLGISQTKLTRIMNRPHEASKDEVLNLAALMGIDPSYLIQTYKMGYNTITLDDFEDIKNRA